MTAAQNELDNDILGLAKEGVSGLFDVKTGLCIVMPARKARAGEEIVNKLNTIRGLFAELSQLLASNFLKKAASLAKNTTLPTKTASQILAALLARLPASLEETPFICGWSVVFNETPYLKNLHAMQTLAHLENKQQRILRQDRAESVKIKGDLPVVQASAGKKKQKNVLHCETSTTLNWQREWVMRTTYHTAHPTMFKAAQCLMLPIAPKHYPILRERVITGELFSHAASSSSKLVPTLLEESEHCLRGLVLRDEALILALATAFPAIKNDKNCYKAQKVVSGEDAPSLFVEWSPAENVLLPLAIYSNALGCYWELITLAGKVYWVHYLHSFLPGTYYQASFQAQHEKWQEILAQTFTGSERRYHAQRLHAWQKATIPLELTLKAKQPYTITTLYKFL